MGRFVTLTVDGDIESVFDNSNSLPIPPDAVEIQGKDYEKLKDSNGPLSNYMLVNGDIVPSPRQINNMRLSLLNRIDEEAEEARLRFVTKGSVQSTIYDLKRDEIARKKAGAQDAELPFMSSRAARKGQTTTDVLTEWEQKYNDWISMAVIIENIKEAAKEQILAIIPSDTAMDEAKAILDSLDWPKPQ